MEFSHPDWMRSGPRPDALRCRTDARLSAPSEASRRMRKSDGSGLKEKAERCDAPFEDGASLSKQEICLDDIGDIRVLERQYIVAETDH